MTALSTHLCEFCAIETTSALAADAVEANLRRFGQVKRGRFEGFDDAVGWFLPLASFPTRYLLIPLSGWTILLRNGRNTAADDQLLSASRVARCRGAYGSWAPEGCVWQVAEQGREIRSVACYRDGDRWVFHQQGAPLPFERRVLYDNRRKKDRLPPEVVQEYLQRMIAVPIPPEWRRLMSQETVYLERSATEIRVPIEEYAFELDL